MKYLYIYLIIINLVAFILYGTDKSLARHRKRRIRESVLILFALFGGSLGALLGMLLFRHKTLHLKFTILVPTFLVLHIVLVLFLEFSSILSY